MGEGGTTDCSLFLGLNITFGSDIMHNDYRGGDYCIVQLWWDYGWKGDGHATVKRGIDSTQAEGTADRRR